MNLSVERLQSSGCKSTVDQETLFILRVMLKQFEDKVELVILSQVPVQLHTLHMPRVVGSVRQLDHLSHCVF